MGEVRHTPGPWFVNEDGPIIRIHYAMPDGRESGSAVAIGSTALQFRAPRQGSHRGQTMVYRPFAEHDRADARLIAAAPTMLDACRDALAACATIAETWPEQTGINETLAQYMATVRAAIAKAEGR